MKNTILLLFTLCATLFLSKTTQAQFSMIHTGFEMNFFDVECISEDTVLLCGGHILKTTDGGHNWAKKHNGPTSAHYIEFADNKVGYAGYKGLIKTEDGGETWFEVDITAYSMGTLLGIYLVDADTLYVYSGSKLFKSTDGGLSWEEKLSLPEPLYGNTITDVFFIDNTGYIASQRYIFKSVDYGQTWEIKIDLDEYTGYPYPFLGDSKLYFEDKDNGTVFYGGMELRLNTTNGFDSYELLDFLPLQGSFDIKVLPSKHACFVGWDALSTCTAAYTTKDGNLWQLSLEYKPNMMATPHYFYAVDGVDSVFYIATTQGAFSTMPAGFIYRTYKPVSVSEQPTTQTIQLYPNPAKDMLHISAEFPLEQVVVYDLLGKEMLRTETINTTNYQMDVSALKTGCYLIKLQTEKQISTQKIFIL